MNKEEKGSSRKAWTTVVDIVRECLLYILLNYALDCVNLSFWDNPVRILTYAINLVVLGKFLATLDRMCHRKWIKWAAFGGSVAVVILLVWLIGYFPISQTPVRLPWN